MRAGESWTGYGPSSDRRKVRRFGELAGWDDLDLWESWISDVFAEPLVRSKRFDRISRPVIVALPELGGSLSYADTLEVVGDILQVEP